MGCSEKKIHSNQLLAHLPICHCRYEATHEQLSEAKLERMFLYCLAWSLGGLLNEKERPTIDAELRTFASNMPQRWAIIWAVVSTVDTSHHQWLSCMNRTY